MTSARIGLFGGSFNPVHAAHQLVALYVLETQPIDELWFVPVYSHAFGKPLVDYEHRVAMCELAAAALGPRVKVSRAEQTLAARPGFTVSRTLDLIDFLAAPDRELRLVVGADILAETTKWYRWSEVVMRAPLIAVGRTGIAPPPGSVVTDIAMPEISATRIRELLYRGDPAVARLLPANVLRYIAERNLYAAPPPTP